MFIEDLNRTDKEKQIIKEFVAKPHQFFVISGTNGTGKTFTARAIYHHFFPKEHFRHDKDWSVFITQSEMNMQWLDTLQKPGWTMDLLRTYQNTKFLVIDDLGTRRPTDAFIDFLYAIVDKRKSEKVITIITTNLNMASMREQFSDAFVSRCASDIVVRFDGEDRRFEKNKF